MKRQMIAMCAAVALVGTLTACSSTPVDNTVDKGVDNGTTPTPAPSGTSYPKSTRHGTNDDYYNTYGYSNDGRYYAYPDGAVAPGGTDVTRDMDRMGQDVTNGTRDLMHGMGDMVTDTGKGVADTGRAMTGAVDHNQM